MPKTPEELAAEAAGEETDETNEHDGKPVGDPAATAIAAVKPTGNEEVDKLVRAALAEVLPTALKTALDAQQAEAKRLADENAAREQGDYKTLYAQSEEKRKSLELDKWRGEALIEAGLDNKWFDVVKGDNKEDMVASAKQFKKHLDAEVKAQAAMVVEESPGTPRGGGKATRARNDKPSAQQKTDSALRSAFGTHRLHRV